MLNTLINSITSQLTLYGILATKSNETLYGHGLGSFYSVILIAIEETENEFSTNLT